MKYCALSEKGKREHNEDSFFIPVHSEVALAAVADGMGGHKAGSTASSLALDVMVKDICRGGERSPEKLIGRAIDAANAAVFDLSKSSDDCRGMGTTLVLAMPFKTVCLVLGQFAYRSVYCNVRFVHFGFIFKVSDYGIFARYHARS